VVDRRPELIAKFSLGRHLACTGGVALIIATAGAFVAREAPARAWAWLPVFWVVANLVEWTVHRYPMHRPLFPRVLYRNHAIVHHGAFHGEDQEITALRELGLVMMPWYTLVLIFAAASPGIGLLALLAGTPLAGIFLVSAVSYFLLYETLHLLHHLPAARERSWLRAVPGLARLRAHHHHHHQRDRMAHANFNVTFPLADLALGTYEAPPGPPTGPGAA
jgi:hypothetical protein